MITSNATGLVISSDAYVSEIHAALMSEINLIQKERYPDIKGTLDEDGVYSEIESTIWDDEDTIDINGVIVKGVQTEGGEHHDYSNLIFTLTFPDGTVRWFREHGWHQSHVGAGYDGPLTEVKPTQKTVTVYE